MPREPTSPPFRRAEVLAMGISALYVLALAYPVHRHVVGIFSDFYRWYAPDADRIAAGLFPRNTYNPPGYPLLLALASPLTGDHFSSGKWISLVAAGLVGVLAFHLHRRLFGAAPALLAVPIILSSHAFTAYAISAMTDVPFVCLCLGAMLVITGDQGGGWRSAALGGVLCGVAYVFRYNGAFLLAPALLGMIWRDGKWISRAEVAAVFLGSFALAAAPWWALNYAHHGSAFYSTNYEDVAKAVGVHGNFTSLVDVVLHDPGQFAWNYAKGVGPMLVRSFGASLALFPVGPLAAIGIALSLVKHRRRPVILVLVGALAFLLFMSLTHWERRYFLFLLACYSGFAAFAIFEIARLVGHVAGSPRAARVVIVAFALAILIPSIGRVWRTVGTILERQPTELLPAARYLASVAPPGATVMAVRAQIAYLSGREWQETPDAKSVEELKSMLRKQPADYLVYDRWGRFRKPLAALATPDASFSWLHPIYRDPSVVIYAVQLDRR